MDKAIIDWNECVQIAKRKLGVTAPFCIIKGKLLKEAQRAYCAMGYSS